MLYFKSILPPKIADVVSCNNIAIDTTLVSYENRIKSFFLRVFGKEKGFIEDEAYWSLLWRMVSDPNKRYGIVAIDGYHDDALGKEDYALVLNMKHPRLRARKIHNLGNVYMKFDKTGRTWYYNSLTDYFDFINQVPARHPHISNSEPCLGNYSTRLAQSQSEGNPIMWLKDINQFLNTWNANSAYYSLNHTPQQMILHPPKDKKNLKPRVIEHDKFDAALYGSTSSHRSLAIHMLKNHLIWQVKSSDRRSEIRVASFVANLAADLYENITGSGINVHNNSKHAAYIEDFKDQTIRGGRLDNAGWDKINLGFDPMKEHPKIMIRSDSGHIKFVKLSSPYLNYIVSDEFNESRIALKGLGMLIDYIIKRPVRGDSIEEYIKMASDDILKEYVEKYVPYIIERNEILADLTVKNNTRYRLSYQSTEYYDSNIDDDSLHAIRTIVDDYNNKENTCARSLKLKFKKLVTQRLKELDVDKIYDEKTEQAFSYKKYDNSNMLSNEGYYLDIMGVYKTEDYNDHLRILGIKEAPKTFKELIVTYENLKYKVYTNVLAAKQETLNKQIIKEGGMLHYGRKANNTEEDSTQVPLSFD